MLYDQKLSPEEWAKKIDFGFEEHITRSFKNESSAKLFQEDLQKKWHVVVPDLGNWPPVKFRQEGQYSWNVKNRINNN